MVGWISIMNIWVLNVIIHIMIMVLIIITINSNNTVEEKEIATSYRTIENKNEIALPFNSGKITKVESANKKANIDEGKIDKHELEKITYEVIYHEEKQEKNYNEEEKEIIMDKSDRYTDIKGVTSFRRNNYRDSASYGLVEIKEKRLEIIWDINIGSTDGWTGVGWNGQPAIVQWPENIKTHMNIYENKKNKNNLKEIIYGTLDRNIYFIDLEDGEFTREPIQIAGPIKGSVTIDPRGVPLLYVGQGINNVNGKRVDMGFRIFSLIDNRELFFIDGLDSFAYRQWPAFDSTPIIDKKTDTLLICGENGLLYRVKLNTQYNGKDNITVNPNVDKYRYKIQGNKYQGIENSIAMYKNLAYFADNGGWLQCIDINTLKPIWVRNITDDTDSTIVIEEESNNRVVLYTACEVDKQGTKGFSYIRKIDALSGELIWEKSYECRSKLGESPNNGGALATPVLGKMNINNMVVFNLSRCGGFNKGLLVALDKKTGEEIWTLQLKNYSWSSPVDIYTKEGEGYILICDSAGIMYLLEGTTGEILDRISLGSNVEGSPAVFENMAVVGTRGQKIYGIKIF